MGVSSLRYLWHGNPRIIWLPWRQWDFCCKQECSSSPTYTVTFLLPLSPLRRGVKLEECDGNRNRCFAAWREGRELKNLMRFMIAKWAYDLPPHLLPDLFLGMDGWKRLSHCLSCRRPSCAEGACQPGLQAIQDKELPYFLELFAAGG